MNKIEKGSVSALVIWVVTCSVVAIIIWPVLDLIYCALISRSEFVYSAEEYLVKPVLFGCIVGLVFWMIDKVGFGRKKK